MDDWIIKLRQFQRETGIRDPKMDAQLKAFTFDRFWFDKPEVTSTVSSQQFQAQPITLESFGEYWEALGESVWPNKDGATKRPTWGELYPDRDWWEWAFDYIGEGSPKRRGIGTIGGISKWKEPSREDRYRYEVMSKVDALHSGISRHLNVALWGDDFKYGTSFKDRLVQYCGKLLFAIQRLW